MYVGELFQCEVVRELEVNQPVVVCLSCGVVSAYYKRDVRKCEYAGRHLCDELKFAGQLEGFLPTLVREVEVLLEFSHRLLVHLLAGVRVGGGQQHLGDVVRILARNHKSLPTDGRVEVALGARGPLVGEDALVHLFLAAESALGRVTLHATLELRVLLNAGVVRLAGRTLQRKGPEIGGVCYKLGIDRGNLA